MILSTGSDFADHMALVRDFSIFTDGAFLLALYAIRTLWRSTTEGRGCISGAGGRHFKNFIESILESNPMQRSLTCGMNWASAWAF
jgi:hypothetical protein